MQAVITQRKISISSFEKALEIRKYLADQPQNLMMHI